MRTTEFTDTTVTIELAREELAAIRNALYETLCELGVEEFETRVGFSFEEGQAKLQQLDDLIKRPAGAD